jgi:hypothetical protein
MMSAPVFGMKRICVFIAIMLVGVTCFAGDEQPKLMPLPPIAPGLQLSGTETSLNRSDEKMQIPTNLP